MNNLIYLLLIPLILLPFLIDDSFACKVNCSDEDYLRIMAGYDTIVYDPIWHTPLWTDHHLSGFWGYSNVGFSGSDAQTLDKTERTLKPAFIVKSFAKKSITADYTVSYQVENSRGKLTHSGSNSYTNMVFVTGLNGESDTFNPITNVPEHSTITYTLKVTSIK